MGKLSDVQIRSWIRLGERFEQRGDGEGLYLRYRKEDAIPRWLFRYRLAGQARIVGLGSYATLSLADARKTAKEMRARVALGHDPQGEKKERKREAVARIEADRQVVTTGQLCDDYFAAQIVGRWKHPNIVRAKIENDIKPHIGELAVGDVTPLHIDAVLQAIVSRGAPTTASAVLRLLKKVFDYGVKRQMVASNPAAAFNPADAGGKEESRERWLTREEIIRLFRAMRTKAGAFAIENVHAVRLLLMLAVRKEELIGAQWREFDLDGAVWHLPAERTKTGQSIDIPLPDRAVETLRELKRLSEGSAYVFPAKKMQIRMVPYVCASTLNTAIARHVRPLLQDVPHFVVHDFRRTARTHLAALGVDPHVAERCLNHKLKGVEGIYDRHDYFEERKAALNEWARLLEAMEEGRPDYNIVPLKKKVI
jgi:integrase